MSVDGLAIHGVFVHHLVMLTGLCQQAALLRSAHCLVHKGSVWHQQSQLMLIQSTSQSTRHCQPASQPGTDNQPVNQGQSTRHNQPGTVKQVQTTRHSQTGAVNQAQSTRQSQPGTVKPMKPSTDGKMMYKDWRLDVNRCKQLTFRTGPNFRIHHLLWSFSTDRLISTQLSTDCLISTTTQH